MGELTEGATDRLKVEGVKGPLLGTASRTRSQGDHERDSDSGKNGLRGRQTPARANSVRDTAVWGARSARDTADGGLLCGLSSWVV
ncbi:hypothetical protein TIFTF001_009743 [Ficus carica]|uniref:Uncharacterized protein n=1 Tax=Ficus carica TaxID=3494 RepID=A0AA88D2V4_FICCA|nr:hypothetical protein TIFTF001_009743 [Ficus carica]